MRHSLVSTTLECDEGDFTFHLVVTDSGRPVKMRIGGWWGKPDGNDVWPFILKPDGRLDFGVTADDSIENHRPENRYGNTDLLERDIFVGREVTISAFGSDYRLKVSAIEELLGSGPKAKLPA